MANALHNVSYQGICGPLNFATGPAPGVGIIKPVGVQWKKSTGKYPCRDAGRGQLAERERAGRGQPRPDQCLIVPGTDAAASALLELDNISKSFGRVVVADNLSLSVGAGDLIGIVGPNGAGKSSLFGLIAGDLAPDVGRDQFRGHDSDA